MNLEVIQGQHGAIQLSARGLGKNNAGRLSEAADREVRWGLQFFCIAPVEEDSATTGIRAAIHIAPAVANHPALGEVKMECFGRAVQHAGRGLTKFGGRVRVAWLITNLDVRDFRNKF